MSELSLLPEWKNAYAYIVEHRDDNTVFTHEWLHAQFGLKYDADTVVEYKKTQLDYMDFMQRLQNELLVKDCIMLTSVRGDGYRVAAPSEQTRIAVDSNMTKVRKCMTKMAQQVSFVDVKRLTDQQKQENVNARAHIGAMSSLIRKPALLKGS